MELKEAISSGFQNYTNFQGRASRSAFWWWQLFFVGVYLLVHVVGTAILVFGVYMEMLFVALAGYIVPVGLYVLAMILPTLAVTIRRLHDLDRSGWWYFIGLVPVVGIIVLLVFFCTEGTRGDNRFGADPLGGVNTEIFT